MVRMVLLLSVFVLNFNPKQDRIYTMETVEVSPYFNGGDVAFSKYIAKNYIQPDDVTSSGIVEVSFVIEPSGKLSLFKIIKQVGDSSGQEAIRVLRNSPPWNPGRVNNVAVRVAHSYQIKLAGND
jgi:periplasmic protein TonB